MANALYALGKEGLLGGDVDWDASNIKCVLTDHGTDTPNVTTDDFLDDISAGTVATSGNFASKTKSLGVADAADVTISAVTGATVESINIYVDTGTPSTSRLLVYIDTATGLALTPNGGDVTITWSNGASKIFAI